MSMTVRLSIGDSTAASDETTPRSRPRFTNPVPAAVTSAGRAIGELDAHLQWDGDVLLARIPLPALPGHVLHATCTLDERADEQGEHARWIDTITVTIDHLDDPVYGGFKADAPPIPAQRARVVDEKVRPLGEDRGARPTGPSEF